MWVRVPKSSATPCALCTILINYSIVAVRCRLSVVQTSYTAVLMATNATCLQELVRRPHTTCHGMQLLQAVWTSSLRDLKLFVLEARRFAQMITLAVKFRLDHPMDAVHSLRSDFFLDFYLVSVTFAISALVLYTWKGISAFFLLRVASVRRY